MEESRANQTETARFRVNRVSTWTFQRFSAGMDLGVVTGEGLQLVGGSRPGSSWSLLLNLPLVRNPSARWRWRNPLVDTQQTDIGGIARLPLKVSGP
jgi:hypothetical protein